MRDECPGVALYVDLLARSLTGFISQDSDQVWGIGNTVDAASLRGRVRTAFGRWLSSKGFVVARRQPFDAVARAAGRDWPARAETMIGLKRLENLHEAVATVVQEGVPGDLLEAGVWRGGSAIFMKGLLEAYNGKERRVWVADSFQGLPAPSPAAPADAGLHFERYEYLAVSQDEVRSNFERYSLLDEQICFLPGWFHETLPSAPIDQLAVLRVDGDLYQSTMDVLDALYPKLSPGGYCIVDDYGAIRACRKAVHHYRSRHGVREPIQDIDGIGVYWRKSAAASNR